jgi:hypothetical protein
VGWVVHAPAIQAEAALRPQNINHEPIANLEANAFVEGNITGNILILDDSEDDDLIWGSPDSGD